MATKNCSHSFLLRSEKKIKFQYMFTKEQKLVMVTFVFHNKAKMIGSLTPSCTNCDRKEKWEHYIIF